jgi:hypothetical protein
MSAEIHFFPNPLTSSGTFSAVVQDNAGNPTDVIEASQPFDVLSDWTIDPITAGMLGGNWRIELHAESLGQGFEGLVATAIVPVVPGQTVYANTITVPGGTFPNDTPPNALSEVYKLVVVLVHQNGGVTTSICALQEGPVVLVR